MTKNLICPNYSHCPIHQQYPSKEMDIITDTGEEKYINRYTCNLLNEFENSLHLNKQKAADSINSGKFKTENIECALIESMNNSNKLLKLLAEK